MKEKSIYLLGTFIIILLFAGCSTPEEKKMGYYSKAKTLYAQDELVKAQIELRNAIRIDPKFADAYYLLAMVDLKSGNVRGAYGGLIKTVELAPRNIPAQLQIGRLFLAAGLKDKAMEKAEIALGIDGKNKEAMLLKASVLLSQKQTDKAESILNMVYEKGDRDPDIYLLLASSFFQKGNKKEAEGILVKGARNHPNTVSLLLFLESIYRQENRISEATAILRRIIIIEPKNTSYRLDLANLLWGASQKEQGINLLADFIKSEPGNETNRISVARFYSGKGMMDRGENVLKEGLLANKNSFELHYALSDLYAGTGQYDKALEILNQCLSIKDDPTNPDIIETKSFLADLYLKKGDIEKASLTADEVIRLSPKSAEAHLPGGTDPRFKSSCCRRGS